METLTDTSTWIQDSHFVPSLWLHPLRHDTAGCEAAKGNYLIGIPQKYEHNEGGDFFTFLVSETNVPQAQIYTPTVDGKGLYTPVPFTPHEFYTLRAPVNLFNQLKRYCTDPNFSGMPLRVEFIGLKEIEIANPEQYKNPKAPDKIDVISYQYKVTRPKDWTPLVGAEPVMKQLTGPDAHEPEEA